MNSTPSQISFSPSDKKEIDQDLQKDNANKSMECLVVRAHILWWNEKNEQGTLYHDAFGAPCWDINCDGIAFNKLPW